MQTSFSGLGRATALLAVMVVVSTSCGGGGVSNSGSRQAIALTTPRAGALFGPGQPWNTDVATADVSYRSDAMVAALNRLGGWGNGDVFQTDFSMPILVADGSTTRREVTGTEDYCYGGPDCDEVPARIPIPDGAFMEGSDDLTCDVDEDDCHLLVVDRGEQKLYEMYRGSERGEAFTAGGVFTWELNRIYPQTLRGDQCTGADAAGFPIAGLTPTADEVAAGHVDHALRFILPNDRIKAGVYVRPATHAGGPESADPDAPPYGVRLRLGADFDETPYSGSQRVILTALKTYGMFLSDGGEIALTFADDRTSTAKWADLGIDSQSFSAIGPDAFDVVELGEEVLLTYECVRQR